MSDWAHGMSGWARRAMCRWCRVCIAPVVLVWRDASYSGALCERNRFEGGASYSRALCEWNRFEGGASYSRALYEGNRFVYPLAS